VAAAPDAFFGTIIGRGTHAASPQTGLDPIWLAAQVVQAIYGLRGRLADPLSPAVVTVGTIQGGTADNIIPGEVRISGTIRTFDAETQVRLHRGLEAAFGIARSFGGDYALEISHGCPPVENDGRVTEILRSAAAEVVGPWQVQDQKPECGADDFSVFSARESALPVGAAVLARAAQRLLVEMAK
jgi:amidohydrolase